MAKRRLEEGAYEKLLPHLHDDSCFSVVNIGLGQEDLPQAARRTLEESAQGIGRHRVQLVLGKIQDLCSCVTRIGDAMQVEIRYEEKPRGKLEERNAQESITQSY